MAAIYPTDDMAVVQRLHEKDAVRRANLAKVVRERKIEAFKREFFLTVASREASGMAVSEANLRAEEVIAILYPPVTKENAEEYLNRA